MTKETRQLIEKITTNQLKKIEFDKELEQKIIEVACQATGITVEQFRSKSRLDERTFARFIVMFYFHRYQSYTVTKAAKLAGKDHATCIHACKVIDNIQNERPNRKKWFECFKEIINT